MSRFAPPAYLERIMPFSFVGMEVSRAFMKAAFAVWGERIAPVFDVARHVRMVEADEGRIVRTETSAVSADSPIEKARWLAGRGVGVLVCGAISRPLLETIAAHGIRVVPFIAGDVKDVASAWLAGTLERGLFAMPGCCGGGRRFRVRRFPGREDGIMRDRDGGSGRGGGGAGRGRAGAGMGRLGGRIAGGPGGACVCTGCGYREPHERGIPCSGKECPKCGAAMTRE